MYIPGTSPPGTRSSSTPLPKQHVYNDLLLLFTCAEKTTISLSLLPPTPNSFLFPFLFFSFSDYLGPVRLEPRTVPPLLPQNMSFLMYLRCLVVQSKQPFHSPRVITLTLQRPILLFIYFLYMCVSVCVCISICIYIYIYVCVCVYIYIHASVSISMNISISMLYIQTYKHRQTPIYIYIYIYTQSYIYIYAYIYICIYLSICYICQNLLSDIFSVTYCIMYMYLSEIYC